MNILQFIPIVKAVIKNFLKRYGPVVPAIFFVLGISFDLATLGRIDSIANIIQQGIYLMILALFLGVETVELYKENAVPLILKKIWPHKELVTHFFFGGLLSAYTIFYFKSASTMALWLFFVPLCAVLVANEFERFQRVGLPFRIVLFSLCLMSYCTYLMPTLYGSVGAAPFFLAWFFAGLIIFVFIRILQRWLPNQKQLYRKVALPALTIQFLFLILYFVEAIPPVPLSLEYIGIYHNVTKENNQYNLTYTRSPLKFWQKGDQKFRAREGDRVFAYFRIFSPTRFEDKVLIRWLHKNHKNSWVAQDAIPINIVGGRNEGYRGYVYKSHYVPGDWRIQVETLDEREIGRLNFSIVVDTSSKNRDTRTTLD